MIEACLHNGEVVQAICENIKDLVDHKCCSKTTLSFYGVTLTQVVSSNPHIDDSFLQRILPFIFSGIKSNNLDYQVSRNNIFILKSFHSTLFVLVGYIYGNK